MSFASGAAFATGQSFTSGADPADLTVTQTGADVYLVWPAPVMAGATHTAIFRRATLDPDPFDPTVDVEIGRVPIGTLDYLDLNPGPGGYAYQTFPLVSA
jgi:hypothetical protein